MEDLPERWANYARLQERLASRSHLDDYSWGLERALNRQIDEVVPPERVERIISSEGRKERDRHQSRRANLRHEPKQDVASAVETTILLAQLRALLTAYEWQLLLEIAHGFTYEEVATVRGTTAGVLRVQVWRLRRRLRPVAAETLDTL